MPAWAVKFPPCTFPKQMRMVTSNIKHCAKYFNSMHSNNHFCKVVIIHSFTTYWHWKPVQHMGWNITLVICCFYIAQSQLHNTEIPFLAAFINITCRQTKNWNNFCPRSNLKIQSTTATESKSLHSSHFQRKLLFLSFSGMALLKAG